MTVEPLKHKELSEQIIGCAYKVHKVLGYGFLEKVYKNAMAMELEELGLKFTLEAPVPVSYRGRSVGEYFADIIIEGKIIVEVKAIGKIDVAHEVQLVNYLRASDIMVGLVINFGRSVEIKRRVFGYDT